jgi:hypothetical protein
MGRPVRRDENTASAGNSGTTFTAFHLVLTHRHSTLDLHFTDFPVQSGAPPCRPWYTHCVGLPLALPHKHVPRWPLPPGLQRFWHRLFGIRNTLAESLTVLIGGTGPVRDTVWMNDTQGRSDAPQPRRMVLICPFCFSNPTKSVTNI